MNNESDTIEAALHWAAENVEFDWAAVEDPLGIVIEEFQSMGLAVDRAKAAEIFGWQVKRQRLAAAAQMTFTERVLGWMASGSGETGPAGGKAKARQQEGAERLYQRRLALRAAVAIQEVTPHMANAISVRDMARLFSVSHGEVFRLQESFRDLVGGQRKASWRRRKAAK